MIDQLRNKRVLVTGVNGQVGAALKNQLLGHCELITASRNGNNADVAIDLSDCSALQKTIADIKPHVLINPAAYTNVDGAESEHQVAQNINSIAPGVIAESCKKLDALFIHYSTDYVFNGRANTPYKESDTTDPINIYGRTKLEGEEAIQAVDCKHLIFRTCWVYDAINKNFPNAILGRALKMTTLKVVNDQIGTPTSSGFLAETTHNIMQQARTNDIARSGNRIYHMRPDGQCSWYDFACAVIDIAKKHEPLAVDEILAVDSNEFPTVAARPKWSVLENQKIKNKFDIHFDDWSILAKKCLSLKY